MELSQEYIDRAYQSYLEWLKDSDAATLELLAPEFRRDFEPSRPKSRAAFEHMLREKGPSQRAQYIEKISAGFQRAVEAWSGDPSLGGTAGGASGRHGRGRER